MTKDEIVEALQGFPIGPGEVSSIAETLLPLFRAQAEKAWEEGWAIGAADWPDDNPYTIQEKEKNHHEKATYCPHSYYAPRCMCSTASGH